MDFSCRDYNYSDVAIWKEHQFGELIDVGFYPNSLSRYYKYLNELKQIFAFKELFVKAAQGLYWQNILNKILKFFCDFRVVNMF